MRGGRPRSGGTCRVRRRAIVFAVAAILALLLAARSTWFGLRQTLGHGNNAAPRTHSFFNDVAALHDTDAAGKLRRPRASMCAELVRSAISSSWQAYKRFAWGHDELLPLSRRGRNWYNGRGSTVCSSFAFTMVDSLDTLFLAGLRAEFDEAVEWLAMHYESDCIASLERCYWWDETVSFFEVSIRVVGGFVSAYELSGNATLIKLAALVADKLIDSASDYGARVMPRRHVSLGETGPTRWVRRIVEALWAPSHTTLATAGSIQLEYRALSRITGNTKYADFADACEASIRRHCKAAPCPVFWRADGSPADLVRKASIGSGGDSYYEYSLKTCLQQWPRDNTTNRRSLPSLTSCAGWGSVSLAIDKSIATIDLTGDPAESLQVPGVHWGFVWFEELACFVGGLFALSSTSFEKSAEVDRHAAVAKDVTTTCLRVAQHFYQLPPERIRIRGAAQEVEADVTSGNWQYILRPEIVESLYWIARARIPLGDETAAAPRDAVELARDAAWGFYMRVVRHLQDPVTGAFASAADVRPHQHGVVPARPAGSHTEAGVTLLDRMESFWIAETLKYLLLIFADDVVEGVDLTRFVFTTEAHLMLRHV